MLIDSLLNELVSSVDGAPGAILVAVDGEAIQWGSSQQSDRLRLRSAYLAVVMQAFRGAASRAGLGRPEHLVVKYDGATLIAQEIGDDCSVVLELKANVSLGITLHQMEPVTARIRHEFGT